MSRPKAPDGTEFIDQIIISVCRLPDGTLMIYDSQGGALPINYDRAITLRDSLNEYLKPGKHFIDKRYAETINRLLSEPSKSEIKATAKRPGYVYLIQSGNLYKIGMSKNVNSRIEQIRSSSGTPVDLICTIKTDDMRKLEDHLHSYFHEKRVRREWFNLDQSDIEKIKGLAS